MRVVKSIIISCWLTFVLLLVPRVSLAQSSNLPETVLQATVKVHVVDPDHQEAISSGSGSIISANGFVLTNYHVVDESVEKYNGLVVIDMPAARRASRFDSYIGRVLTYDPEADLAVVQITHTLESEEIERNDFPFIPHGSSRDLMEGDQVYAIGYPDIAGGRRSVTQGIVSAIWEEEGWILSDVDISNGNSGGPLLSADGRLIGIPTWGETGTRSGERLGYSRPIEAAEPLINAAIDMLSNGGSERGDDGIFCADEFRSNEQEWPIGFKESDSIEREDRIAGGALHRTIFFKSAVYSWINAPKCNVENFLLVFDAQMIRSADDDNAIVITLREQETTEGTNNYYQVLYYRDGSYEVNLRYNNEWQELQARTPSAVFTLAQGEVNTFAIRLVGSQIGVFSNGEWLGTVMDDTLPEAGEIGLGMLGDAGETVDVIG